MAGEESAETRAAAALPEPWPGGQIGLLLARLAPSGRSLALGFAALALGALAYAGARQTSVFAVCTIEVRGAPAVVATRVRAALAPTRGKSLLAVGAPEIEKRLGSISGVVSADFDRAFPHTLRIFVRAERPVAVLRDGRDSWLVSARARVLRRLPRGARQHLPRIWVPATLSLSTGGVVEDTEVARAVRACGLLGRSKALRVRLVRFGGGELTFVTGSYSELRLGSARQLRLKLAVARRVLGALERAGTGSAVYVDVSVPARPVAGALGSS